MTWPTASRRPSQPLPARTPGPLQWQQREEGAMGARTVCGWYSWCCIVTGDKRAYEAWTREPLTGGMKQLAVGLSSLADAKAAAQADADKAGQPIGKGEP